MGKVFFMKVGDQFILPLKCWKREKRPSKNTGRKEKNQKECVRHSTIWRNDKWSFLFTL